MKTIEEINQHNVKINLFKKLEYKHISHDLIIKNNFFRNITINSRFNPVSSKGTHYSKIKNRIANK